jgi:site-specific recombinase XerD
MGACDLIEFQHSAATLALAAGHDRMEVRDMLGHTKVATTERYAHILAESRKWIAESMERLLSSAR